MNASDYARIACATTLHRPHNQQAIQQFLDSHAWQVERIEAELTDEREGRVEPAEQVFVDIAARYGWKV